MTSAQSLLRLLSGNNPNFLFLVLLLTCGCSIFKPATHKKGGSTNDTVEDDKDKNRSKVDTIDWTIIPELEVPPIEERTATPRSEIKSEYNVVLVAPFDARDFQTTSDRISSRMSRMLEFYAGAKLAWQRNTTGIDINFSVIDSKKDPKFLENFSNDPSLIEADVIIGPYFTDELLAMAKFAKERHKVILSPWNTTSLVEDNPFYMQLRPNLKMHADALTHFIRDHHRGEEILLMCKRDDRDSITLTYFEGANLKYAMGDTSTQFTQMKIDAVSDPALSEQLILMIEEQGLRTFAVPNWSDQPFVISALAKINFAKADHDVTVYGLPQWMSMSKMDYNYYENLNVHVSTESPLKFESDAARKLKRDFFNRFGTLPSPEAYYGQDVMMLVSELLKENGTLITVGLDAENYQGDHRFEFVSIFGEDGEQVSHHENQYIQIVKFEDFQFVPADD